VGREGDIDQEKSSARGRWKSEGKEEPVQIYNKLISLLLRKQHNKTSVMASKYFTRRERARSTNLILLAPMP
jgi:hypothetical protein